MQIYGYLEPNCGTIITFSTKKENIRRKSANIFFRLLGFLQFVGLQ